MTQPQPDFQALTTAQGQTRERVNAQVQALAANSALAFTGWYSAQQITDWAAHVAALVEPLLKLLARNTDAFQARAVSGVAGARFRPVGAVDVANLRTGVTHAGAYARAADTYRWQQSQFDQIAKLVDTDLPKAQSMLDLADPKQAAVERVKAVADMDTQLVVQQQSQATLAAAEDKGLVTGWRRVIHPELAIHGSCGLCVTASDRVYKVDDLMPLHNRCNCVPMPILDGKDPGSILNADDLKRLYSDAGGTHGHLLKRTTYQVSEHGELGPVLNDGTFRTPMRVRKATSPNRAPKTDAERHADVKRIYGSLSESLPKLRELAHDSPRQWDSYVQNMENRVAELQKELAA